MERRYFLKLAFGFAAGPAAFAASARAAPLVPHPLAEDGPLPPSNEDARPAVTNGNEVEYLKPEEGRRPGWGRRHWCWLRRHWGWRCPRAWRVAHPHSH